MTKDITSVKKAGEKFSETLKTNLQRISEQCELLKKYIDNTSEKTTELPEQIKPDIREMIDKFGLSETIKRIDIAIQKDKFRPRNMTIVDFASHPDLFIINGKFSTFDPELSRMYKRYEKMVKSGEKSEILYQEAAKLRKYINENIKNDIEIIRNNVIAIDRYIDMYPDLCDAAIASGANGDIQAYNNFFVKIADSMLDELAPGDNNFSLGIAVIDSWADVPKYILQLIPNIEKPGVCGKAVHNMFFTTKDGKQIPRSEIYINRGQISADIGTNDKEAIFIKMCNVFAHELGHVIDRRCPNRGMLGKQMAQIGDKLYSGTKSTYINEPTELSSFKIGDTVGVALNQKFSRE